MFAKFSEYQHKHPHSKDSFRDWAPSPRSRRKTCVRPTSRPVCKTARMLATELEAYVEAAKLAFASGDMVQARTDLTKVATLPVLPLQQTRDLSIEVLEEPARSFGRRRAQAVRRGGEEGAVGQRAARQDAATSLTALAAPLTPLETGVRRSRSQRSPSSDRFGQMRANRLAVVHWPAAMILRSAIALPRSRAASAARRSAGQ